MIHYNNELVYPKLCKVIEVPAQGFVYPIFKNASSSLEALSSCTHIVNKNFNITTQNITVYLRDAQDRFNSGVNTYLQHNKSFDTQTIIQLVQRGELVNRHFMPQYMWLCHLYKHYTGTIHIKNIKDLYITVHNNNSGYSGSFVAPTHWIDLDNIILEQFKNTRTSLSEINKYIQDKHKGLYKKCIVQE